VQAVAGRQTLRLLQCSLSHLLVPLSGHKSPGLQMCTTALGWHRLLPRNPLNPLDQLASPSQFSTYPLQLPSGDHTSSGSSLIPSSVTEPDAADARLLAACLCAQQACMLTARLLGLASLRKLMHVPFTCCTRSCMHEWRVWGTAKPCQPAKPAALAKHGGAAKAAAVKADKALKPGRRSPRLQPRWQPRQQQWFRRTDLASHRLVKQPAR
jgi:hypothetical protein